MSPLFLHFNMKQRHYVSFGAVDIQQRWSGGNFVVSERLIWGRKRIRRVFLSDWFLHSVFFLLNTEYHGLPMDPASFLTFQRKKDHEMWVLVQLCWPDPLCMSTPFLFSKHSVVLDEILQFLVFDLGSVRTCLIKLIIVHTFADTVFSPAVWFCLTVSHLWPVFTWTETL